MTVLQDIYGRVVKHNSTEKVALKDCVVGDVVSIGYSPNNSWKSVGKVKLIKIKDHPKGGLQIKYQSVYRYNGANIHKMNIPGETMVDRYPQMPEEAKAKPEVLIVSPGNPGETTDRISRIVEEFDKSGTVVFPAATTMGQIANMSPSEKELFNVVMDRLVISDIGGIWPERL